jgi:hypothetical protein
MSQLYSLLLINRSEMPAILNSWKEIAAHMNRGVRTVQRWEKEGLPIRRIGKGKRAPVFALTVEIDTWFRKHGISAAVDGVTAPQSESRRLQAESQLLLNSLQRSGVDFLFLDLEIATTMARTALKAGGNTKKRSRSQKIARRAYDTILYLSQRLKVPRQEDSKLKEKLAAVKRELERLGEPV